LGFVGGPFGANRDICCEAGKFPVDEGAVERARSGARRQVADQQHSVLTGRADRAIGRHMTELQSPDMVDSAEMLRVAEQVRAYAKQMRANAASIPYPTAGLDADMLEKAATYLEQAASELEALRSEC